MTMNKCGLLSLRPKANALTAKGLSQDTRPSHCVLFKKRLALLVVFGSLSVLTTGCTDRVMLAEQSMADIRAAPAQEVEPPPAPELVEDYTYAAMDVRSPFIPPSLVNQQEKAANYNGVTPDITRIKQPLESFELTQLSYRGVLVSPEGEKFGLIQRPDGVVDSVKVGDYMGMSDGRIVEITPTQINLIEIVPDNRAGFIEKPASVVSPI